ncbi:MAG: phosphoribosylformylglycinamidine cyclo-ligase [Gammaproteobacteria bacterium]|nr:phosphoribosylformylglycinamidine cyclo-ligase [Gammaproteobacteria bacterium]
MSSGRRKPLTYRDAGVDIESGNRLVERLKPLANRTRRPGVVSDLGGFGGLFEVPVDRFRRPVLVSGTDGVGTKLRLAIDFDRHRGVGIDLVAMCANDVVVQGAEPLYFLDYYATGKIDERVALEVLESIARGCELAGMALIGGETAEMPGMYAHGDYDLAGFCVGVVEHDAIIDGRDVVPGDALLGLASSGPHSNGYSLIRTILSETGAAPDTPIGERTLIDALLEPTRIYVKSVLALIDSLPVKAIAHITGGGLSENIPRVLPQGTRARLETGAWAMPEVFHWLQKHGAIEDTELRRTFNCGIGMVVCVAQTHADAALEILRRQDESAHAIGVVEATGPDAARVTFA